MFGIEHYGVQPDIMVLAKGMANGLPIAATIATETVARSCTGASISTFGGNPVASAAALATIEEVERQDTPGRSARLGERLRSGLLALQEKYPFIGDVRGMGLMQALELVEDRKTKEPGAARTLRVAEATRRRGLLIGKGGLYGNIIRLGPPMLIGESEVDEALEKLDNAFNES
jgi:4-aminobutyrate aminotransferase-like enzyme